MLSMYMRVMLSVAFAAVLGGIGVVAQQEPAARPQPEPQPPREPLTAAPSRGPDEGKGPFKTLVIRGVMVIDGTGAPPRGPMDVVVSGQPDHRRSAAPARQACRCAPNRGPQADHEVDATGMYLMPGFVDHARPRRRRAEERRTPSTPTSSGWRTA